MSRKRFSADQWRAWFEEFQQCGLTVQQFCDSKATTANTFYNWRHKLKRDTSSATRDPESSGPFVSMTLLATPVEFELPGGSIARVPNDRESLRPILEVLFELGARS